MGMTAEDAVQKFLAWMAVEKRASLLTIDAYRGDLARFLAFMTTHLGGPPAMSGLASITLRDLRAWLAHEVAQAQASRPPCAPEHARPGNSDPGAPGFCPAFIF
jgi:integrase/recombinase XerC